MFLAPEVVGDIPVGGSDGSGHVFATLHVPGFRLLTATDIGPNRTTGDGAAQLRALAEGYAEMAATA